jgi:hypothetical protein
VPVRDDGSWALRLVPAVTSVRARVIVLLAAMVLAAVVGILVDLPDPGTIRQDLAAAGVAAPLLAVPVIALLTTLLVPRSVLTVLAGVVFPPVTAIACAVAGSSSELWWRSGSDGVWASPTCQLCAWTIGLAPGCRYSTESSDTASPPLCLPGSCLCCHSDC